MLPRRGAPGGWRRRRRGGTNGTPHRPRAHGVGTSPPPFPFPFPSVWGRRTFLEGEGGPLLPGESSSPACLMLTITEPASPNPPLSLQPESPGRILIQVSELQRGGWVCGCREKCFRNIWGFGCVGIKKYLINIFNFFWKPTTLEQFEGTLKEVGKGGMAP